MFQIKFAVCLASYSVGNATEHSELCWLGDTNWVYEFDEATFFESESTAENAMLGEKSHGTDARSLSIVKVLCNDCSD
jgi:hypothetical protein